MTCLLAYVVISAYELLLEYLLELNLWESYWPKFRWLSSRDDLLSKHLLGAWGPLEPLPRVHSNRGAAKIHLPSHHLSLGICSKKPWLSGLCAAPISEYVPLFFWIFHLCVYVKFFWYMWAMWVSQVPHILVNPAMTSLPYFIRDPLHDSWKYAFQMSPLPPGWMWKPSILFWVFPPVVDPGQKRCTSFSSQTVSTAP